MKIHRLTDSPPPWLEEALAAFEQHFRYPLGPADSFSISHAPDYTAFFRSMGTACVYVAEVDGAVAGILTVVRRAVILADGSRVPAAYFCDTKVAPQHRGTPVLARLALMARDDVMSAGITAAYAVVMAGSPTPDSYTGRLGIPAFRKLASLIVMRIPVSASPDFSCVEWQYDFPENAMRPTGGDASNRSLMSPLAVGAGHATGVLMDTRRGKRLWDRNGTEMLSAHLVNVSCRKPLEWRMLLDQALLEARRAGFPAVFTSLPASSIAATSGQISGWTRAAVFGIGLPGGCWQVDTAEI